MHLGVGVCHRTCGHATIPLAVARTVEGTLGVQVHDLHACTGQKPRQLRVVGFHAIEFAHVAVDEHTQCSRRGDATVATMIHAATMDTITITTVAAAAAAAAAALM